MRRAQLLLAAAVALGTACASGPSPYRLAAASAERAYVSGRYDEAASRWLDAARAAKRDRDREEAEYRHAATLVRAERTEEAMKAYDDLERKIPKGERSARVRYDRAVLELERGDGARGLAMIEDIFRKDAESAMAERSFLRWLEVQRKDGESLELAGRLAPLAAEHRGSFVDQRISYERATMLERLGDDEAAVTAYLDVATRFPYPTGSFWDDSLFHAAELEVRLHRPTEAIANLRRMLVERETSHFSGSYERGRYSEAQLRIAQILRDDLHDPSGARREFARLWTDHPTSRLKDDAKWSEALLARDAGDIEGACAALETLASGVPDSRYVACASIVRPRLPATKTPCHAYVARSAGRPQD